jgi:rSAM/selenodomain-associated transferase 1
MAPRPPEAVAIAILAKAPVPGLAKTRLQPALGAEGAAALQAWFIERTVETAAAAGIGPVTVWATPDETHPTLQALAARGGLTLLAQPNGDLGERMRVALAAACGPALVIGTDCPALTPDHLRLAAEALRSGNDVVLVPVEDGGYALIGARKVHAPLFAEMEWGTATVMAETRRRAANLGLSWRELEQLWDVDEPADLIRMQHEGFAHLLK